MYAVQSQQPFVFSTFSQKRTSIGRRWKAKKQGWEQNRGFGFSHALWINGVPHCSQMVVDWGGIGKLILSRC
jgi:hypothetical protein